MPIEDISDFEQRRQYRQSEETAKELGDLATVIEQARLRFPAGDLPLDFSPSACGSIVTALKFAVELAKEKIAYLDANAKPAAPAIPRIRIDSAATNPDAPARMNVPPESMHPEVPSSPIGLADESILDLPNPDDALRIASASRPGT